jgi:hypothetical protein
MSFGVKIVRKKGGKSVFLQPNFKINDNMIPNTVFLKKYTYFILLLGALSGFTACDIKAKISKLPQSSIYTYASF